MTTPVVAAFDFDGTLTRRDTLRPFLRMVAGRRRVAGALLANLPGIARATWRRSHRDIVKERILASCLAGLTHAGVAASAERYATAVRLRDDVVAKLRVHQREGHHVIVVSASPALYVAPVVRTLGVEAVLATELEVERGVLTGRLAGPNCRAQEKVVRLEAWLDGRTVELHAYGNSPDDAPMLERADVAIWV